jgi:hypothetical protein
MLGLPIFGITQTLIAEDEPLKPLRIEVKVKGGILQSIGSGGEQPLDVRGKVRCKSGAVPQL